MSQRGGVVQVAVQSTGSPCPRRPLRRVVVFRVAPPPRGYTPMPCLLVCLAQYQVRLGSLSIPLECMCLTFDVYNDPLVMLVLLTVNVTAGLNRSRVWGYSPLVYSSLFALVVLPPDHPWSRPVSAGPSRRWPGPILTGGRAVSKLRGSPVPGVGLCVCL